MITIPVDTFQTHAQAIAEALWAAERANPSVDFTALHAALLAAFKAGKDLSGGGVRPLDGGQGKTRVWSGDNPAIPVATIELQFPDLPTAQSVLAGLWTSGGN